MSEATGAIPCTLLEAAQAKPVLVAVHQVLLYCAGLCCQDATDNNGQLAFGVLEVRVLQDKTMRQLDFPLSLFCSLKAFLRC